MDKSKQTEFLTFEFYRHYYQKEFFTCLTHEKESGLHVKGVFKTGLNK